MKPLPIVPPYLGNNLNQIQKCLNWYHEKTLDGFILRSVPGYQLKGTTANNAACRGAKLDVASGLVFSVHGNTVYQTSYLGVPTALSGTVSTTTGICMFASGSTPATTGRVLLIAGSDGYVINPYSSTVTHITDVNFPASPYSCACINGQFLVTAFDSDRWYMSAVDNALTWTPVISARTMNTGDPLYHPEVVRDTAYFFGAYSIEQWVAKESDPFLQPLNGGVFPVGLINRNGLARVGDSILFCGIGVQSRKAIWMIAGGQLAKVSPPYIDEKIGEWGNGPSRSFAYSDDGHDVFEIYNDSASDFAGWRYDITSQTWSEISLTRVINYAVVSRDNSYNANGYPTLGFSKDDGSIYWLGNSSTPYNQFGSGNAITRTRIFGPVGDGTERIFHSRIRFVLQAAFDATPSTTFTGLSVDWTDDDGKTYSTAYTPSITIAAATTGQLITAEVRRLGKAEKRFYRMTLTGAAQYILQGVYLDAQQGPD